MVTFTPASRTMIITGASRGLGRALAMHLAECGHTIIACARNVDELQSLQHLYPQQIIPYVLDLQNNQAIIQFGAWLAAHHPQTQVLINNAGLGAYKPLLENSLEDILAQIQVNLTAAITMSYAVLPLFMQQQRGHIINIGSDLARRPLANMAVYAAAKHGLAGFSHSLLREVKTQQIKVSLINPGIIDTHFGGGTPGTRDHSWALAPSTLVEAVVMVLNQADSVVIDELTIHPLQQGEY
jgi:short-subunit dehydrogenase